MRIVAFKPEHLARLRSEGIQRSQMNYSELAENPAYAQSLAQAGPAFSAIEGDRVLCCAGVIEQWKLFGVAWAVFPENLGSLFVGVHLSVKRFLKDAPFRRIETAVDCKFKAGNRWIKMLGFKREGRARAYSPDGRDCYRYALVKI